MVKLKVKIAETDMYKYQPFSPLPHISPVSAQKEDASSVGSSCQSKQPGGANIVTTHADNKRNGHAN